MIDTVLASVKDYGATGALVALVLMLVLILREITALTIGIKELISELKNVILTTSTETNNKVLEQGTDRADEHNQMIAMLSQQNMVLSLLIGDENFRKEMANAAKELGLRRRKDDKQ